MNILFFSVKTTDYFDPGIMDRLTDQVTFVTNKTQIDLNGSSDSVTFHSSVRIYLHALHCTRVRGYGV
jgi:hypothetical protein